jgi:SAM-dependent methyltransferase
VALFRARAPISNHDQYREVRPRLEDYAFPHHVLDVARMERALRPERLECIRREILGEPADPRAPMIRYRAPWHDESVVEPASQDLVFSQAVLEHVDALREAYAAMRAWLKPGGYLSHQIDFKSHGYAPTWDGHWRYGDFVWRLVRGPESWFINRQPYSAHQRLLAASGFRIVHEQRARSAPSFARGALAPLPRHARGRPRDLRRLRPRRARARMIVTVHQPHFTPGSVICIAWRRPTCSSSSTTCSSSAATTRTAP